MTIAAAILAGGNREHLIGDAIKSVDPMVDHVVLIDTGSSAKAAIQVGRELLGDRCTVFEMPEPFDCATGRNFCLDRAHELGFDWALPLDTDERMHGDPATVRRMLDELKHIDHILIDDASGLYKKPKFIRVPRSGYWDGVVHEAYVSMAPRAVAIGITFSEVPKCPVEQICLIATVEYQTRKALEQDPNNARYHYYRGDSLAALDRFDEAVEEFLQAAKLSRWDEEIDWSHYRAAQTRYCQAHYEESIGICLDSTMRIPELPWLAALGYHSLKRYDLEIEMANKAADLAAVQRKTERVGFANRYAWWEGPFDCLRWAYHELGNLERETVAYVKFLSLKDEREKHDKLTRLAA